MLLLSKIVPENKIDCYTYHSKFNYTIFITVTLKTRYLCGLPELNNAVNSLKPLCLLANIRGSRSSSFAILSKLGISLIFSRPRIHPRNSVHTDVPNTCVHVTVCVCVCSVCVCSVCVCDNA